MRRSQEKVSDKNFWKPSGADSFSVSAEANGKRIKKIAYKITRVLSNEFL
jgi:hypothetical protein